MSRIIPKNWTSISLGKTGDLVMGQSPSGSSYNNAENGLPLLNGAAELRVDGIDVKKFTTSPVRKSEPGDLLFCIRATIGNLNVSDKEYCLGRGVAALRVSNKYSKKYVGLQLEALFDQMRKMSQGGVIKGLKKEEIGDFKFPIPVDKSEQQKIADIILSVESAIQQTQKMIDQSEKLKKTLMKQLFTRGISHTKFKKTEIGEIPANWEAVSLVNSGIEIIDGDRGLNYPKQNEFSGEGFCLFLNTPNVNNGKFNFNSVQFISEEKDNKLRKGKLQRDDVVLTTRGTVGRIAHYDQKVPFDHIRINSGMVILRVSGEFFAPFVFQQFLSEKIQNAMKAIGSGSAQPQLPIGSLNHLVIAKPPLNEQKEIVEILQSIDNQIEVNKKLKSKQEQLKRGLMQDLLTGKVAV